VSFFDYLASFLAYPYVGEIAKQMNWNGVVRHCRPDYTGDVNGRRIQLRNTEFAALVWGYQDEFVDKLQNYRGVIYHSGKDSIPAEAEIDLLGGDSDARLLAPKNFLKVFESEFTDFDRDKILLTDVAAWVYVNSITIAIEILEVFQKDISKHFPPVMLQRA
jgi:hypothetical protein